MTKLDTSASVCPSSRCEEGALLLGRATSEGDVRFLDQPIPVDKQFVETARAAGAPERYLRFAGSCLEGTCPQWRDGGCNVARRVEALTGDRVRDDPFPKCSIRPTCRWWRQIGSYACRSCRYILNQLG